MNRHPLIQDFMSKMPQCIAADSPLTETLTALHENANVYVPVIAGRKVVGILNQRTAKWVAPLLGSEDLTAADLMSPSPAIARPDASLYQVLDETPSNPYGCTVVQKEDGSVVGIFTPREAMLALHGLASDRGCARAENRLSQKPRTNRRKHVRKTLSNERLSLAAAAAR